MDRIVEKVAFELPEHPRSTRVAAYARVSSEKDAMFHSLSAQISYYSDLKPVPAGCTAAYMQTMASQEPSPAALPSSSFWMIAVQEKSI